MMENSWWLPETLTIHLDANRAAPMRDLSRCAETGFVGVSGPQHISTLRDDGKTLLKYVQNISTLSAGETDDALMAFQHRYV